MNAPRWRAHVSLRNIASGLYEGTGIVESTLEGSGSGYGGACALVGRSYTRRCTLAPSTTSSACRAARCELDLGGHEPRRQRLHDSIPSDPCPSLRLRHT